MRLPDDPTKYTAQFKYVELGRALKPHGWTREKRGNVPVLYDVARIPDYVNKYEEGIYASIFQYDSPDLDTAARLGSLYFDLDSSEVEESRADVETLVQHLLQFIPAPAIRAYFSGCKGFHVEVEALGIGVTASDELAGLFRFIARDIDGKLSLSTLDYAVYDERRMWRIPNSRHQRSGLYKVECMQLLRDSEPIERILEYAREPRELNVPEQVLDSKANRWFREYTYEYESSKQKKNIYNKDTVNNFLKSGAVNLGHQAEKIFDSVNLTNHCGAVSGLVKKAYETHHLEHYERLFLCSLLTYDEQSIQYLHRILSQLSDYSFEISNSHIEDWIRRREMGIGGRPFTCQKAKEVGISCENCEDLAPLKKKVSLDNGTILEIEEFSMPSPVRFAYRPKRG